MVKKSGTRWAFLVGYWKGESIGKGVIDESVKLLYDMLIDIPEGARLDFLEKYRKDITSRYEQMKHSSK